MNFYDDPYQDRVAVHTDSADPTADDPHGF